MCWSRQALMPRKYILKLKSYIFKISRYLVRLWQGWSAKVSLSIFDQGIFSGANFILHILLARWLLPSEYGIFAITIAVFLFLSSIHQAVILDPMSIIGAAYYHEQLPVYISGVVWIHLGLAFILTAIISLVAIIMVIKGSLMAFSFLGLAIVTPLILFFWLFRRACYLKGKPSIALAGSLVYCFLLLLHQIMLKYLLQDIYMYPLKFLQ